ncbi:hypothetical protein E0L36_04425 [Streptomyces sp. AJS327]|uniref:ricin-type beta-trefoil lectin domain protein n=1 Tax=Streptomyces sp. AJS327 TaxID=2545265 RepID=UPI0015DE79F1|nr:ricin-type beta-trefoil lectin domain protein [Streptomyces sp. AJS327]MBA0050169.1 hypothetical protein [Streptomyces sp. AJS327]
MARERRAAPHSPPTRRTRRSTGPIAATAALLLGVGLLTGPAAAAPAPASDKAAATPSATPLTPELERLRAEEARKLYGDPGERPLEERKTSLISLGDSQISGEGVGNYEPGTDGPDNWCHRSPDVAVHRTGIDADVTYNVACSGASSKNIRIGGEKQYADELVQSDSLAITARNTRLKQITLVVGANDDLQFGPVMTDCVVRWLTLQGPCQKKYEEGWQDRVDGLVPKVEATVNDLKTVMRDAGYAEDDYQLVLMSYPSPIGPDFRDNPDFPGKLVCGGTGYDSDTAWGRDHAVPAFQKGLRTAAQNSGATYLDASRLFHGHEVCTEDTRARGLHLELDNPVPPDENTARQSFHPNKRGHGAYAECLTQIYQAHGDGVREASCADQPGTGKPRVHPTAWDDEFTPLRNAATGECLDAREGSSRNGTAVGGWKCADPGPDGQAGQRNQGWWLDGSNGSLVSELSQDRCLDIPKGDITEGAEPTLYKCSGADNQRFEHRADQTIRPTTNPDLCLTLTTPESPLTLAPCTSTPTQHFTT